MHCDNVRKTEGIFQNVNYWNVTDFIYGFSMLSFLATQDSHDISLSTVHLAEKEQK